jgi:multisubunit Na+/H+ antiporter MnhB subunit
MSFFLRHPGVGLVGTAASIISVPLALILFFAFREHVMLTFFVNPARAAVIRTAQTSRLAVQFDGTPLKGDVTAVQVAFWNAGKTPIRIDGVLKPLTIRTKGTRILEARLRKATRDVAGVNMDATRLEFGELLVRWNILEANDGAVIQLVYQGDEAVSVTADATLVGQPHISMQTAPTDWEARLRVRASRTNRYLVIGVGSATIATWVWLGWRKRKRRERLDASDWTMLITTGIALAALVGLTFFLRLPGPPFGFE